MASKDMEQRQWTDHVVIRCEQQCAAQPAVIDDPRIAVLRDFRHARRAARVEIGRDTVACAIGKGQRLGLARDLGVEILDVGMMVAKVLGPDKRHNPRFRRRQIAVEINLQHGMHTRRMAHGLGGFLRHIGFRKRLQGDDDLSLRLAQDRGNLFRLQQRVDRIDDPRDGTAQNGQHGLVAIGQDAGNNIAFLDTKAAEQVGRLACFFMQLPPSQGFCLVLGTAQKLKGHRLARRVLVTRLRQHLVERLGNIPVSPGHFRFNCNRICDRCKTHRGPPFRGAAIAPASSSDGNVKGFCCGYKGAAQKVA